jgi:hypothetical protein
MTTNPHNLPAPLTKDLLAVAPALARYTDERLLGGVWTRPGLQPRDRSIVTFAALIAQPNLSVVCFRVVDRSLPGEGALAALNRAILERLQLGGEAFLTNTELGGWFVLRACFVNYRSTREDVDRMPEVVDAIGREIVRGVRL